MRKQEPKIFRLQGALALLTLAFCMVFSVQANAQDGFDETKLLDLCPATKLSKGRIEHINDNGDVELKSGTVLRLADVHIPRDKIGGTVSSRFVESIRFAANNRDLTYIPVGKSDRYQRQPAHLFFEKLDASSGWLQATVIRSRSALFMPELAKNRKKTKKITNCTEHELAHALRKVESETQGPIESTDARLRHHYHQADDGVLWNKEGEFVVVEGVITSVSVIRDLGFINFGENYKTDFTATLTPALKSLIENDEKNLSLQAGKRVQLRGYLDLFNGPAIRIDHPMQVEFLN